MITQEKMYEVLFDNKEYVYFIISKHFKKAEPNEKTYKTMLKNNIYFKYLCSLNKNLIAERTQILNLLNTFENKFWLKKEDYCFVLMLKQIKNKKLSINNALKIVPIFKIINGFYGYLSWLNAHTTISHKKLEILAQTLDEEGVEQTILFLIKNNMIK